MIDRSVFLGGKSRINSLVSGLRIGQFLSVGILGAGVDTGTLTVLTTYFGVSTIIAKIASAEVAILIMFYVNDRWTFSEFRGKETPHLLWRFLRSNIVRIFGVGIATMVLLILVKQFSVWVPLANIIGIVVGFVVNYLAESIFTWRVLRKTN